MSAPALFFADEAGNFSVDGSLIFRVEPHIGHLIMYDYNEEKMGFTVPLK